MVLGVPVESSESVVAMSDPTVSVVIPTNLDDEFLREAVASVVDQTYQDWELVVVVNGCGGDFRDLPRMDPRVRVVSDRIASVSRARNIGGFGSRGRMVAFLDHDDVFLPEHLALQVAVLNDRDDAGMCYGKFHSMDREGNLYGADSGREARYTDFLRGRFAVLMSTTMVRRSVLEAVGGFDPLLVTGQDIDFILRVAQASDLAFIPEVITYYRRHGGNASGDPWTAQWDVDPILRKHRRWARRQDRRDLESAATAGLRHIRFVNAHIAYDEARAARKEGDYGALTRSAVRSLAINPMVGPADVARSVWRIVSGRFPAPGAR
jgi:glycosyltransferase involved in cell wall biosynthesis